MSVMLRARSGFGLLEIIVSFAIIGLGLGGALGLMIGSGFSNRLTSLRSTGTELAREGIEVLRSMRDSNGLQSRAFDTGLVSGTDGTSTLVFSPTTGWDLSFTANAISDSAAQVVGITIDADAVPDFFTQGIAGGVTTPFRRLVTLTAICDNGGVNFTYPNSTSCTGVKAGYVARVTVQWTEKNRVYTAEAVEDLFDWHP